MLVIPAVDVLDGQVVRLLRGDYAAVTRYGEDPVGAARTWLMEGATLIHVVDLGGARSGRPDPELWRRMGEAGVPFQVGGGVRSAGTAEAALAAGAGRVVLGTAAVQDPGLVSALVAAHGADRIAVSVDVRGGRTAVDGWHGDGPPLEDALAALAGAGPGWLVVTSILRDGTLRGPDLDMVRTVVAATPGMLVMAAGGVGSVEDLVALRDAGVHGAIIGRALYDGTLTLATARAALGPDPAGPE